MLYDRWRRIARAHPDQPALFEVPARRVWTFAELLSAGEAPSKDPQPVVFPQGSSVDFVLTVLRAWRAAQVVCPLEPDQARPDVSPDLPPGIVHLKMTSATTGKS